MQKVCWQDGAVLGAVQLRVRDELAWAEQARLLRMVQESHQGLWSCVYDEVAFAEGYLRWKHLVWVGEDGCVLEQGEGIGPLSPCTLDIPWGESGEIPGDLELWIWPSAEFFYTERMVEGRDILLEQRQWKQSFMQPAHGGAICIQRWRMKARQWERDLHFYPMVLRLSAHANWYAWWQRVRSYVSRAWNSWDHHSDSLRNLSALRNAWEGLEQATPRELYRECARLLGFLSPHSELPSYGKGNAWLLVLERALQGVCSTEAQSEARLHLTLRRSSQTSFSASIPGDIWRGRQVSLRWMRKIPFSGDEYAALRIAPMGILPRLVKSALPGIPLQNLQDALRDKDRWTWELRLEVAHVLWDDVLSSGSLALHCWCAGEEDEFHLCEVV